MDKGIFITIGIIVVALGTLVGAIYFTGGFGQGGDVTPTTDVNTKGIILFYGRECPHCKDVEDFISANNIAGKVSFVQSEVWHNKSNAALLGQKVQICKITTDTVGVPFLFDGNNKCYIGKPDVIDFLNAQAGIK
ncbi:MAG: hypothetical protein NTW11_01905 [Candidatus Staskawiczbacteria bacterium]|nr:hypothetical protein [Candidatus Staskawiczbacteria bacterium]